MSYHAGQGTSPSFNTPEGEALDGARRAGDGGAGEAPLEKLVEYLLASKRSLASTEHVWRANEIVTTARAALEDGVVLGARTGFLRRGVDDQVKVVRRVKDGVDHVGREAQADFEDVLRGLDEADARLQHTQDLLRTTMVEAAFRPAEEERRNLHDFVDEGGVEKLKAGLRASIDQTQDAQREFGETAKAFDDDLASVRAALMAKSGAWTSRDDVGSPIPPALHSLESHAKEMADGLESLVRHFDFCVTAIKHTEGGGAAAQNITGDLPAGVDVNRDDEENDEEAPPPEPISDEERREMLQVLEKDAAEVEDVVMEIRDRLAEMEAQADDLSAHLDQLSETYSATAAAFRLLEEVGARLPGYVSASRDFLLRWEDEKARIAEQTGELESLREFYDAFLHAYDGLVVEVGRRRAVQTKMEAVVRDAMARVERLYEDDLAEREAFKHDQGVFLPADIWPGLAAPPLHFEVAAANRVDASVPELPRTLLQGALRRVSERG
ncbi:MAG: autophagy protein 17 [Thelocarpon impressellum]|nr:MAG: autophagy protein 17 [Thelocarpon impressellum]